MCKKIISILVVLVLVVAAGMRAGFKNKMWDKLDYVEYNENGCYLAHYHYVDGKPAMYKDAYACQILQYSDTLLTGYTNYNEAGEIIKSDSLNLEPIEYAVDYHWSIFGHVGCTKYLSRKVWNFVDCNGKFVNNESGYARRVYDKHLIGHVESFYDENGELIHENKTKCYVRSTYLTCLVLTAAATAVVVLPLLLLWCLYVICFGGGFKKLCCCSCCCKK